MKKFLATALGVAFVSFAGCKPQVQTESDFSTTGCPTSGEAQDLRRKESMPDFARVSMPILKKIVQRTSQFETAGNGSAQTTIAGRRIVTMLRNMVAGGVHPLAFFATIADYETYQTALGGFPWAEIGKRKWSGSDLFRAGYCGSSVCVGVFQVLVFGDWFSWAQDNNGKGLGVWGMKGGPDWASTLWWWTVSSENNCNYLAGGSNPCTTPGIKWSVATHVRNGRRAYGQQRQCGVEWDAMYWSYLGAMKKSSDPLVRSITEIQDFSEEVGLVLKSGSYD
ncbi:hypothetical protein EBU99_02585 [bacterium]|nr:hypothetical protein [bacterium]